LRYRTRFTKPGLGLRLMKPLALRAVRRIFLATERRFNELVDSGEVAAAEDLVEHPAHDRLVIL
jgi:hypothetical protein